MTPSTHTAATSASRPVPPSLLSGCSSATGSAAAGTTDGAWAAVGVGSAAGTPGAVGASSADGRPVTGTAPALGTVVPTPRESERDGAYRPPGLSGLVVVATTAVESGRSDDRDGAGADGTRGLAVGLAV